MNFLLLTQASPNDWAFREWKRNGIPSYMIFKEVNIVFRAIRRFWVKFSLPFLSLWLSKEWKNACRNSDVVVVHMSCLTLNLPKYINKINSRAKVIAWYWNVVNEGSDPRKIKGKCELWSFDPNDCKKYGMKFNHQYYFKSLIKSAGQISYDVFFCGSDSGRGKKLFELYNKLHGAELKVLFKIVYPKYEKIPESLKSNPINYDSLLGYNVQSKALLEIMRSGQVGATVRVMESLFLRKKIITNNVLVLEEPFYNEKNIFVLGKRDFSEIKTFVDAPYDDSVNSFIDEYDFKQWLERFA